MESHDFSGCDSAAARTALDVVANVGGQIADRVYTPWWYRVGLGLSMAVALVALGVNGGVDEFLFGHFNLLAGVFVSVLLSSPFC